MDKNQKPHPIDSDSDQEIEDQNWDDWETDNDDCATDEQSSSLLCLFCDTCFDSSSLLLKHCGSVHSFDFEKIKKDCSLDFYNCVKLINYVRSQVAARKWSDEELRKHIQESVDVENNEFPWDDDRYLKPFLQDDALLYSFDEDVEFEKEDDTLSVDSEELTTHLSKFKLPKIDEGCSSVPELISPLDNEEKEYTAASKSVGLCENGAKEVETNFVKVTDSAEHSESHRVNGDFNISDGTLALKTNGNESYCDSHSRIMADSIKNTNKNYFGGYSSFGIHKDMISDKVRTDAYRTALMENPSLLRGAVVMDVGCGTGILSLFAAQGGASSVLAVEASDKMAAVAAQVAKDNGLLLSEGGKGNGVMQVVRGMIEEIGATDRIRPHSIDVLVSEWMGYCLLYETMLSSVLFARDLWLKPGGAILPDTATMFVAGFGRGGTTIKFWDDVYGFDMSCIGRDILEDAAKAPIVDIIDNKDIVTTTDVLQSFDLATMQPKEMDFTAEIELEPKPSNHDKDSNEATTQCYGLVVWFDTGFSERFCKEKPVVLSTSPYGPSTHWSQTILTFREPITMASNSDNKGSGKVGTDDCPAARIRSRISIVRSTQHRSIDISMELTAIGHDDRKRNWPAQMFYLR